MSPEIGDAWKAGFKGQGTTITFVDDFKSASTFGGNFGPGYQVLRHGEWTRLEASLIAPSAAIVSQDFNAGTAVPLARGLNVINLSYGMYAAKGYAVSQIGWSGQEASLIKYASGAAVISKAAGNDGVVVGAANAKGQVDYLNNALIGKSSAIFVGALNSNGAPTQKASLASYSNRAGADLAVQQQFLTVGVAGDKTGLYGTSFAAPIVSGYAAVLGSKFTTATATSITNQLLNTARQDTVQNYSMSVYGRGEASLSRALAPASIK
jgi:subtilisin family serine protease